MRNMKLFSRYISESVLTIGLVFIPTASQAGELGSVCMDDVAGIATNCNANDIGVNNVKVTKLLKGCISPSDVATVNVTMEVSATVDRYNIGLYIATDGGDAVAAGSQCFHDALFPIGPLIDVNRTSGVGPFYDKDSDQCGDLEAGGIYLRTLVTGDIPDQSIIAQDFNISCSKITNGLIDLPWGVSYSANAGGCTTLADAKASAKSKCKIGVFNTGDAGIPIGVPDMSLTLSCVPDILAIGETSICTVTYTNNGVGPADYLEFHLDYNETYGSVSEFDTNITTNTTPAVNDKATDNGDYINWIVDANQTNIDRATSSNILPAQTGTLTFLYTAQYEGGPYSVDVTATAFFNNDGSSGVEQNLSAAPEVLLLPVTVNYAYPRKNGNSIDIDFSTASEIANIGFNIYAVKGKKWIKLNEEMIPGSLDSFEPKDYHASVSIPEDMEVKKIGIAGIDLNGAEDRHGPFRVDHESGSKSEVLNVDWKKVRKQIKKDRLVKKAAKKAARKTTKIGLKDQVVTLNVSENAVYHVTHNDLLEAGINLKGQKANNIAISFREKGIVRHIEGLNKKGKWSENSAIEFIGRKLDSIDALYVNTNRYQLELNKKLAVDSKKIDPLTTHEVIIDNNNRYALTLKGGDPFYEAYFFTLNEKDIGSYSSTFNMPVLPENGTSLLRINTSVLTEGAHSMSVMLNEVKIADATAKGKSAWIIETSVDNTLFQEIGNKLSFTLYGEPDDWDMVVYDKMTIVYDGEEAESKKPNIEVTERITKEELRSKRGINYVIVAHPLFIGATLDRYVKQREGEGWNIKVVNVEDIYAAYDNGMATPAAIKAYLKDIHKEGVTHVQLIGAASYDYHDYLGIGSVNFIPSLYTLTNDYVEYTPCDACYVMDSDELPFMAIGRWPVRTLEGLEHVVSKTLEWKTSGQSNIKTALLIADQSDSGYDFSKQMETMANKMNENGWSSIERVYLDEMIKDHRGDINRASSVARENIIQAFSVGPSILSYSGHAATSVWSFKRLLDQSDIVSIDNRGRTAIALPFACQATFADSPYINTIAHQLLAADRNGAVAIYGAAAMSSFGDNGVIASRVLANLIAGQTLGEAVKNSKRALGPVYRDVIRNGNLIGDVTLELK